MECIFDNPDKKVLRESREVFTHCPKMLQISNFFETINISPTCSLPHVECNSDNSWKSFGNRPKKIVQLLNILEEVQKSREFFPKNPKRFLWTGGMNALWQTRWKIFQRRPKNSRSLPESEEGNTIWWEVFCPRSVPMVTLNAILLTPSAQVPRKAEFITADVR